MTLIFFCFICSCFSIKTPQGDKAADSDRKLFYWDIDFAVATQLKFSKFVSKSLRLKW